MLHTTLVQSYTVRGRYIRALSEQHPIGAVHFFAVDLGICTRGVVGNVDTPVMIEILGKIEDIYYNFNLNLVASEVTMATSFP